MKIKILFITILLCIIPIGLYAQTTIDSTELAMERLQNNTDSTKSIEDWAFMLRISKKNLNKKFNHFDKNNLIVNMYKLHYSLDSIEIQLLDYMAKDPIHACNDNEWHRKCSFVSYMNLHKSFYAKLDCQCKKEWAKLDSNLINLLVVMDSFDQKYRKNLADAPWIAANKDKWIEQQHYDTYNQVLLEHIFERYGYPSYRKIGLDMEETPFAILIHCSLDFQEKYAPLVQAASERDEIPKHFYAQICDRILMLKGKAQIYGTQLVWNNKADVMELYQVKDMTKIDELRRTVALPSLKRFLKANNAIISTPKKRK